MSVDLPSLRSIPGESARNAILARLLVDAAEALEGDTERARASLARAVALVGDTPASAPNARRGGLASWQAQRTTALIGKHLHGGARIGELAANLRMSRSHFSRAFKKSFGRSPQQFILERRIEHAQELMLAPGSRLSNIALDCWFADQAH